MKALGLTAVLLFAFIIPAISSSDVELQGVCNKPRCERGDKLFSQTCQCRNETSSTCPRGFNSVSKGDYCSCERSIKPNCPAGHKLVGCKCVAEKKPDCSSGYTLIPSNAVCQKVSKPYCPRGYYMKGCRCFQRRSPTCPANTKISSDKCDCIDFYFPECKMPCVLSEPCKCIRGVYCYIGKKCSGKFTMVSHVSKCCGKAIPVKSLRSPARALIGSDDPFANLGEMAEYVEDPEEVFEQKRMYLESYLGEASEEQEEDYDEEDEEYKEEDEDDEVADGQIKYLAYFGNSYKKDGKCWTCPKSYYGLG